MGRKNFNRRGKMGRRARKRRALASEETLAPGWSHKRDSAPRKTDDSVLSTKKRKFGGLEEIEEPAETPKETVLLPPSESKAKHRALKEAGDERKRRLHRIREEMGLSSLAPTPAKKKKKPLIPVFTPTDKIPRLPSVGVLPPKFGEVIDGPSDKISALGRALVTKLNK